MDVKIESLRTKMNLNTVILRKSLVPKKLRRTLVTSRINATVPVTSCTLVLEATVVAREVISLPPCLMAFAVLSYSSRRILMLLALLRSTFSRLKIIKRGRSLTARLIRHVIVRRTLLRKNVSNVLPS